MMLYKRAAFGIEFCPDYFRIGQIASASLREGFPASTANPSSTDQMADRTAWANPQANARSEFSFNLASKHLSLFSTVCGEANSSGFSTGFRRPAPISYSTSPITPFGSIANQPRSESNRML